MNRRRVAWRLALSLAALTGPLALAGCRREPPPVVKDEPPEVLYTMPSTEEITDSEDFTGRTDAIRSVDIRARVNGYLTKIFFDDGAEVEKDAPLFEIDPRPYQATSDRTESSLAQAEARQQRTEADYRRAQQVYSRGAISREEYDLALDNFAEAKALVGVARAERDTAKLNLDWTRVSAPITGRLSRRMVDVGNLVKSDDTILTNIVALDPIYVNFDVDERTLLRLRRLIREGKIKSRTEAEVPVLVALADEPGFPHRGLVNFSDNRVDPNTGTLRLRGEISNPVPRVLSPGLFMRVRLPIGTPHRSLMVPEQALWNDQGKKFVYVVDNESTVRPRELRKMGPVQHEMRVVEEGLTLEDRVVVSGLQRLRPGRKVKPRRADESSGIPGTSAAASATPTPAPTPRPAASSAFLVEPPSGPRPTGAALPPAVPRRPGVGAPPPPTPALAPAPAVPNARAGTS